MKKRDKEVRNIIIKFRVNENEMMRIKKLLHKTTEQSLSNYMRELALNKPVTVYYRNQSADNFLHDMLLLKKELNAIGNNFNQAVHKLHILDKIPEFRFWVNHYDGLHRSLVNKVEEIKLKVGELYYKWFPN
ncbi:MAG: plasmid mobilization relaxosome protein MobC [Bacteroidota bacterium]|nr:plasmid mobilization relaxosome protein MobC [Bacteroidota bacterium]